VLDAFGLEGLAKGIGGTHQIKTSGGKKGAGEDESEAGRAPGAAPRLRRRV
jgi:hypothetical protein